MLARISVIGLLIAAGVAIVIFNTSQRDDAIPSETTPPKLLLQWVVDGFSAPEGVAFTSEKIFISNVAGNGTDKDGEGWVSVLSYNGDLLNERLIEGLNAPKGMAVRGSELFIADIDHIHIINHETGELSKTLPVADAGFLNDVTNYQDEIYVSDSETGIIHRLRDDGVEKWMVDPKKLKGVNGLTELDDRLLIATMNSGSLYAFDGTELVELANGMISADGIGYLPDTDGYLVSSWPGQIWHVSTEGHTTELLNTQADPIFQNDLTIVGGGLVVVPNWQPGTVTAWRIE